MTLGGVYRRATRCASFNVKLICRMMKAMFLVGREQRDDNYSPHGGLAEAFHPGIGRAGVQLQPVVMLLMSVLLVSDRINKPTRFNGVPSCTTAPSSRSLFSAQTRQSLWIYTTVIVENMQTVCEGLHVNCTTASGDSDSDGPAALCSLMSFCWNPTRDLFPLGCVCVF